MNKAREDSYISLQNISDSLQCNVTHIVATNPQYAENNATPIVHLGSNAVLGDAKLTTISNK